MRYTLIQFIEGWDFQAYQVTTEDGWTSTWYDLDGNLISTGMKQNLTNPLKT